jgi:hypothetical protein
VAIAYEKCISGVKVLCFGILINHSVYFIIQFCIVVTKNWVSRKIKAMRPCILKGLSCDSSIYARPIVIWFSISFFSRNDLLPEAVLNPLNSHQQISSLNNSKQQQCS